MLFYCANVPMFKISLCNIMIEMSEESAQPDVSQSQNRITKKVFFYFPILVENINILNNILNDDKISDWV